MALRHVSLRRFLGRAALLAVTALTLVARAGALQAPAPDAAAAKALAGAIDIHAHSSPDRTPRSIDSVDLAKLAKSRGMRGIVLKNHFESTAAVAYIARKESPGVEVFGGIVLNLSVGGVNPAAIDQFARMSGGKGGMVWFPTNDSEQVVVNELKETRTFAPVSRGGSLLPETKEVIALIVKNNLSFATGHATPEDALRLVREGRAQNLRPRMVITHAMRPASVMSVAQMQEAAQQGAFIEFNYNYLLGQRPQLTIQQVADTIRRVGVANAIVSTDLGGANNPLHPDGLAAYVAALQKQGFTSAETNRMTKENPARLLGLPVQ